MSASLATGAAPIGRENDVMPFLTRRFDQDRLVIASHNQGKVSEIQDLLAPFAVTVVSAAALGLPEPEEIGDSFAANAALKARLAARASAMPALSDDSGLCVAALDGRPGIHSARWGGPERDWGLAMRRVWDGICAAEQAGHAGAAGRRARFVCALALAWPDGRTEIFEGDVTGRIVWPGRGQNGFGYDPIFVADGMSETFGEMEPARKHAISHRARAFAALVEACFGHRRRQG